MPPAIRYPRPAGPTIGEYVPPAAGQPKTGIGSAACKLAMELHGKALLLSGGFDPTFIYVTEKMVQDACYPTSRPAGDVLYDDVTYYDLEHDDLVYADFEASLFLMAWIIEDWESGLYVPHYE